MDDERPEGGTRSDVGDADGVSEGSPGTALTAEQLGRLREVIVAAHPEAVPELIAGSDFEALLASVAGARAAYVRIAEEAARGAVAGVPRGGGTREFDAAAYEGLSPEAKIAAGLGATSRQTADGRRQ